MIYREFQDKKLSMLGFGMMRLPVADGDDAGIDMEQTEKMIARAMESGINYYDTAYGYHNGNSERAVGAILSKYPRESYYLADKFPGYDLVNMPKVKEIFAEQLEKTKAGYFDFYLFHNVCEMNIDQYLDPQYGIYDHLMEQKKNGCIRHLGFSAHAEADVLKRFLDAYGKDMEFCQLQINYLDWKFQNAEDKVKLVREYGIPVWVMEPLRGGMLASLPEEDEKALKALRPDESVPAWAFRFLQSIPDVRVILSGMSDMEQLSENIRIFGEDRPLQPDETEAVMKIAEELAGRGAVPCTACHYCVSHCPAQLDIPKLIALYNEHVITTSAGLFGFIAPMQVSTMPEESRPSACLHCQSCEQVCPQQIRVSDVMQDFVEKLKG